MIRHIAVIDVGKTNVKLALVRAMDMEEVAVLTRSNQVINAAPYPHFDVKGHWTFFLDGLREFNNLCGVDAISITTHGACAVLLDQFGNLATPVLDYEHKAPDDYARAYDAIRPDFSVTGSPKLKGGLNIGAQLFWLFSQDPNLRDKVTHIVTYPQYWGYLLTKELACDVTSLGCHTDLWNPHEGIFSTLVDKLKIKDKIAPLRHCDAVLGTVLESITEATGLTAATPVYLGIHDSNASLLPHILARVEPFSVVSTGTWVIAMAMGGKDVKLDPDKDTLMNVNALGKSVKSARFMGGREFEIVLGGAHIPVKPRHIIKVLEQKIMLFPSLQADTGPFQGRSATWHGCEPNLGSGERATAASFYLALVTAHCLSLIGHQGEIIVEGPFSLDLAYLQMLSAATNAPVIASKSSTGTSTGAALLVLGGKDFKSASDAPVTAPNEFSSYAADWHTMVMSAI
jgi:sugar (pentulose or hexulose) kinase